MAEVELAHGLTVLAQTSELLVLAVLVPGHIGTQHTTHAHSNQHG